MSIPRLFALFTALMLAPLAIASGARAGDVATLSVLGFSADGGTFAFEEYGVQDGSGFPYANRFYIDTGTDTFLPGTPVRVRIEDETASVEDARTQAKTQGQAIIADSALDLGHAAGRNPVTELSADFTRMAVNPRPVFPPVDDALEFRIEDVHLPQLENCPEDFGSTVGFRLLRIATAPGAQTTTVHEDASVPASRGCPLGYKLAGVQTFYPESGPAVFAVLIAIRGVGFEGPDYRYLAVAGAL